MPRRPEMLFADPRFRSPTSAVGAVSRVHSYVMPFEVKPTRITSPEGFTVEGPCEVSYSPGVDANVRSLCGLGREDEISPDDRLALVCEGQVLFECDLMLLNFRRLNVETKVDPHALLARTDTLKIVCSKPMMVWLFGVKHREVSK